MSDNLNSKPPTPPTNNTNKRNFFLTVLAVVLVGVTIFCFKYFSVERYNCDRGYNVNFPSVAIAQISCSSPEFLILCAKGSYISFQEKTKCTTTDNKIIIVKDRTAEQVKDCQAKHGKHAIYSESGCTCKYGFMMVAGTCMDRNADCAFLGAHGVAVFKDNEWLCGCPPGYGLAGDPPICESVNSLCVRDYGNGAQQSPNNPQSCDCKHGFSWNASGTKCICPDYQYEKNGVCIKKPYCGIKGIFNSDQKKCVCADGAEYMEDRCFTPDELCTKNNDINSQYNEATKLCECKIGYKRFNGTCHSMRSYCMQVYGPRASDAFGTDNVCRCTGEPCQCSPYSDPTDLTPCR